MWRRLGTGRNGARSIPTPADLQTKAAFVHAHEPAKAEKGEVEQAADAYRQALALATELGMRPLVAHCHFGLGKLYRQTNKREQA